MAQIQTDTILRAHRVEFAIKAQRGAGGGGGAREANMETDCTNEPSKVEMGRTNKPELSLATDNTP